MLSNDNDDGIETPALLNDDDEDVTDDEESVEYYYSEEDNDDTVFISCPCKNGLAPGKEKNKTISQNNCMQCE
eukprot:7094281-Ditylum_brightwellii.AAC.1